MKVRAKLLIVLLSAPFFSGSTAPAPVPRPSANKFDSSPFAVGEKLVYAVEWNPPWYLFFLPTMDAGEAELSLAGETVYGGKRAVKIIFQARLFMIGSSGACTFERRISASAHPSSSAMNSSRIYRNASGICSRRCTTPDDGT